MLKNTDTFDPGFSYHIYNRAVGNEKLFFKERNYHYFLSKFESHLSDHLKIYAFCLMRNHFHFLTQVKGNTSSAEVSEAFRRFGISYSQAINNQEGRMGSLFMRPIKRIRVTNDDYFRTLIVYIHTNSLGHGVSKDFENYDWSSYRAYLDCLKEGSDAITQSDGIAQVDKKPFGLNLLSDPQEIIQTYFEDLENFRFVHRKKRNFDDISDLLLEY